MARPIDPWNADPEPLDVRSQAHRLWQQQRYDAARRTTEAVTNVGDFDFFTQAFAELKHARVKFPGEEGQLTDAEWLTVLVEEVGEAARAMQDETDERLREELVQVAAMAARWARSIPHGRGRVPWRTEVEHG